MVTKKRIGALLLVFIFMAGAALTACSKNVAAPTEKPAQTQAPTATPAPTEAPTEAPTATEAPTEAPTPVDPMSVDFDTLTDVSDLPDWTGPQLDLTVWQGHGTGDARRVTPSNDIISPEVKRAFGLVFDHDKSYDNAGQDIKSKLAVLAATNDFPEIGYNCIDDDLISSGKLYDLTDLIPVYAPHYYAFMQQFGPTLYKNGYLNTGKQYQVFMNVYNTADAMATMFPNLDIKRYSSISMPTDTMGSLSNMWVRDDILKLAYPQAKTQKEIEDMYVANGSFTRDQIYDVPLKSRQDVIDFFYKLRDTITANNITENGQPVYATFLNAGQDNWALLAWLRNQLDGKSGWNYFTYYDLSKKTIEIGFLQDWFKEDVRMFGKFITDGVAPESCLIDDNAIFSDKLNNGQYAVSYAWLQPDFAKIQAAGKPWSFRKVYIDIPQDLNTTVIPRGEIKGADAFSIFKDKVDEADLPQILRYLDFMYTDAGSKFAAWGPRTAGVWQDTADGRRFTNKEIEDCLVYGATNGANEKYNLPLPDPGDYAKIQGYPGTYIGIMGGGINAPRYVYNVTTGERTPGNANNAFSSGAIQPLKTSKNIIVMSCDAWTFTNAIDGMKRFWEVKGTGYEPLLTKCLAAKTDADFEAAYKAMIDFAAVNGFTTDTVAECIKYMQDNYPNDWANYAVGY